MQQRLTMVSCLLDCKATFAECPIWSPEEEGLYWIDVGEPSLNFLDVSTGQTLKWLMPEPIGACAMASEGRILVALRTGCHLLDPKTGKLTPYAVLESDRPTNRLNDGRCDAHGRFWVGSMADPVLPFATGTLYSVSQNAAVTSWQDGLFTSNGLAFSTDNKTMYHSDSHPSVRTIWAYDFDIEDGVPSNRRVFVDTRGTGGRPDGAAVDSDSCYWSASADSWSIIRYTPTGEVDVTIPLPVSKPSMLAFGGKDMKTLFVTSLRPPNLDVRDQPLAGGIFAVDTGFSGMREPIFKP